MMVIDASAVVELLLGTPRAQWVKEQLRSGGGQGPQLHAPAHLDLEVLNTLRRMEARAAGPVSRLRSAAGLLPLLPLERHTLLPLSRRIWALRRNATAYDAAYVALAEGLGCPLLTLDHRLAGTPGVHARIICPS
jgi:predicted nucleic acid-binding protein